jgi:hypothetical protein
MRIIKELPLNENGLKESTAESELIRDFPPILKEDNPEVLAGYIAAHARESGANTLDEVVPDAPDGTKGKRARTSTESEAASAKAKKQKVAKSEATNYSAPGAKAKRRRSKGETVITKEQLEKALEEIEAEEHKPKRKKQAPAQIVTPMFKMTPALKRMANERADDLIADKKDLKAQYIHERDENLKAPGLENCDEYYKEKIAEVKAIVGEVAEDDMEEEMMIIMEEAQGANASEAETS